jgi:multidrug transporter EmrE-like cation transporter
VIYARRGFHDPNDCVLGDRSQFGITGDAMIRRAMVQSTWIFVLLGIALLAGYDFVMNADRTIDFGRLMGLYIAIFFVVSQAISLVLFGERPSVAVLAGGALIVAGW